MAIKGRTGFYAGMASALALLGMLCAWAFSRPRTPLQYLVAGTFATSILLTVAFVQILKKGYLGPIRRGATGSKPRTPAD